MLQVISAHFDKLQLEVAQGCLFDSVTLYDGSTQSAAIIDKLCAHTAASFTSSGPSMLVVFLSDSSTNMGGFALDWTFVVENNSGRFTFCFITRTQPHHIILHELKLIKAFCPLDQKDQNGTFSTEN